MKSWIRAATLATCIATPMHEATAGGWTQEPGEFYVKVWTRSLTGTGAFSVPSVNTPVILPERFQAHRLHAYAEYGAAEGLTLVGFTTPMGIAAVGDEAAAFVGPTWGGARVRLHRSGHVSLATQVSLGVRVPVGDQALFDQEIDAQRVVFRPTLGTGTADAELQLGIGFNRTWMSFHLGARGFTNGAFLPALTGFAQFGWKPTQRLAFEVNLPAYRSLGSFTELDVLGVTNTRYLGVVLSGSGWLSEHFGVTASFGGATLVSSNAGAAVLSVGVELR